MALRLPRRAANLVSAWVTSSFVIAGVETLILLYLWLLAGAWTSEIHAYDSLREAVFGSGAANIGVARPVLWLNLLAVCALWVGFRTARREGGRRLLFLKFLAPGVLLAAIAWNIRGLSHRLPPMYAYLVFEAVEP